MCNALHNFGPNVTFTEKVLCELQKKLEGLNCLERLESLEQLQHLEFKLCLQKTRGAPL